VVALSKLDVTETKDAYPEWKARFAARGIELRAVSAATGEGVRELLEALWPLARRETDPSQ
jgi:GTP-binding protein